MNTLDVLINCEMSGVVREAFRKKGHNAVSCDIVPSIDGSEHHIQADAIEVAYSRKWDVMIAHPPCTFLANSGARHLYSNGVKVASRWEAMAQAAKFFRRLYDAPVGKICIENPIMHYHGFMHIGFMRPTQYIQPWQFGHGETKATGLYLKGLRKLLPTKIVDERVPRVHHESPGMKNGLTRQQRRSITYQGIADAMAEQWGRID